VYRWTAGRPPRENLNLLDRLKNLSVAATMNVPLAILLSLATTKNAVMPGAAKVYRGPARSCAENDVVLPFRDCDMKLTKPGVRVCEKCELVKCFANSVLGADAAVRREMLVPAEHRPRRLASTGRERDLERRRAAASTARAQRRAVLPPGPAYSQYFGRP